MAEKANTTAERRCPFWGSAVVRFRPAGSLRHPDEVFPVAECRSCGKVSRAR